MMYEYKTFPDLTLVTHSELREKNNNKYIEVYFEKPIEGGFCSANCILPTYEWTLIDGYSKEDIKFFIRFLVDNCSALFRAASTVREELGVSNTTYDRLMKKQEFKSEFDKGYNELLASEEEIEQMRQNIDFSDIPEVTDFSGGTFRNLDNL